MQYGKDEICGVNTSQLKLLSEIRKQELLKAIKSGTPQEKKHTRDENGFSKKKSHKAFAL